MRTSLVSAVALGLVSAVLAAPPWRHSAGCTNITVTEIHNLPVHTEGPDHEKTHHKSLLPTTLTPAGPDSTKDPAFEKRSTTSTEPVPSPTEHKKKKKHRKTTTTPPTAPPPAATPPPATTPPPAEISPAGTEPTPTPKPVTIDTTKSTDKSTSADNSLDAFTKGYVDLHNQLRAKHSAPALRYNSTLAQYAQKHVDEGSDCIFQHSSPYVWGENIGMGYATIEDCIQAWYDEVSLYDYNNPGFSHATGHYTQVVWVATTDIGCAKRTCGGNQGVYYSCNYNTGNVVDDNNNLFRKNVLRS